MEQTQLVQMKEKIKKLLPKLKCAFHQNQNLTNFCSCSKCLLPLCPTCIKIHTIQHVNMKTDPQYQNLFDVILNLNIEIKDFLTTYQQNQRHLTSVQQKIHRFKEQIFSNIDNLKKSIVDQVQKYFTELFLSTEQKIAQMKYLQDLDKHKSQIKKSIVALKKFDKLLTDQSISGKFVIRNVIKYSSKKTDESLQKFDSQCKNLFSKVDGSFCQFSLRQNLKNVLNQFLGQIFKINIIPIPTIQSKQSDQILSISKKLHQFTAQVKSMQKNQIKNTLNKVMSKMTQSFQNSSIKNKNISSQSQLNSTVSYDKNKQNKNDMSQVSKKIFDSSHHKRSFMNHSSQRKSLNISRSFCENDQSIVSESSLMSKQNNYHFPQDKKERRSLSKGKGLSLIQPRYSIAQPDSKSLNITQQIRLSLAQIENVNFQFDVSKVSYIKRR